MPEDQHSAHSLYILNGPPRLVAARFPILASMERFSSASKRAKDGRNKQIYWLTPLATVPAGEHTVGDWRFKLADNNIAWCKATTAAEG